MKLESLAVKYELTKYKEKNIDTSLRVFLERADTGWRISCGSRSFLSKECLIFILVVDKETAKEVTFRSKKDALHCYKKYLSTEIKLYEVGDEDTWKLLKKNQKIIKENSVNIDLILDDIDKTRRIF